MSRTRDPLRILSVRHAREAEVRRRNDAARADIKRRLPEPDVRAAHNLSPTAYRQLCWQIDGRTPR